MYEDEDQPLFEMTKTIRNAEIREVSLVMVPPHPEWKITSISPPEEPSEWVCIQEDCDDVHHYYVKQTGMKVAL